ncbi:MAG: hypothetical protein ACYTFY_19220 [Planctomycetota bacterium]|jgi:hypothetical protein
MWTENDLDTELSEQLSSIDLADGVADGVMAQVRDCTVERKSPALSGADILLYAAVFLIAATGFFFISNYERIIANDMIAGIMKLTAIVSCISIGAILTFGAKPLAQLDNRIICKITGRNAAVETVDIVLVRLGAIALLAFAGFIQLGII